ncbi:TRAP transporter large permease subunit [Streptomyces flavofungini]|uniref:TRAP transporter large permease subunit n=1 Tax=Streptomyces flavofungini TaxID=68200 RepID=A0ABS0X9K4_9ACTN|nr:TRAP transporter large permease subunit [Streptomyces flavofungini]MBJ3809868.1 TRAP transporter large permease subunit [Streptomyces flavofungini]GHC54447.1 C4-dicarboxylate ABC transporter substrate-binding protein [Streptomyces flavofungini]
MNAILALVAFIGVIVIWNVGFRRNIGEAMVLGFLASATFGGTDAPRVAWESLVEGLKSEITFAALAFVFVSELLTRTGLVHRMIDILSSLLGRRKGGSAYAATVASGLFGAVAHNGAAIVATVGSLAIPWMKRSRASGETAALVLSGNAGVGATFPFSGAFFVLLAAPTVVPVLSSHDVVATLFVTGAWMVGMRLVIAYAIVRWRGVGTMTAADIRPLRQSFGSGWTSLLVLAAVAVPVLLTAGPGSDWATDRLDGLDATDAVPLLMWLPVVMLVAGLLVERRALPHGGADWWRTLGEIGAKLGLVGVTMVSAFAASEVLARLGLGEQLAPYLKDLQDVPPLVAALVVGLVLVVVAGPLNTTSTLAAVGPVAFAALTAAGIPAHVAFASVIVWASSEGCSPPGAAPLYVAAGIADINPARIFLPVALYYLVPTYLFGVLMAVGVLWVPG